MNGLRRLPDFLVIGQEDWDEVERRNQLLVRALAARNPRSRFLFVELPRNVPRRPRAVAPGIFAIAPARPLPDRVRALARVNDRLEAWQLRRELRRAALEQPALWTQDPRAADLVGLLSVDPVVYDLTDDWAAFEDDPVKRAATQRRIEALGARADVVLACSRPLAEAARPWARRVEYVPNAVEPPGPVEPVHLGLTRPVLGYAGTLHDARLDVGLLARAAELRPEWSFVLLGPDLLRPESRRRLAQLPNVHSLPAVPHADVRRHVAAFDVCLIPHRDTEFTRSLDPLKRYEYLAVGRPVVEGVQEAEELVSAVERALAEDSPARAEERRAAVSGQTWDARAEHVERALGLERTRRSGPDVSVVVVSHNTRELLTRCLDAVAAQDGVFETLVVDNASTDGSAALVRERFPGVELVVLEDNVGFARANNLGFERCRGEYVLLLNPDCFLEPDALRRLVASARRRPEAGALGPRLHNPDGSLQRSAWPFPRPARLLAEAVLLHRPLRRLGLIEDLGTWAHDEERAVDFLVGACLLLRRDALAEVCGFDERFWLYGEEADLCLRLARRGWKVVLVPDARALHVGGASSGGSPARLRHFYRGQKTFLRKHGGPLAWPLARAALLAGSLLRGRWRMARLALDPRL